MVPIPFRVSSRVLAIILFPVKLSKMGKQWEINKTEHLKLSYAKSCLSIIYVAGYARQMYNN